MARFLRILYIAVFVFFVFQLLGLSSSHPVFRRASEEGNATKGNKSEKKGEAPCLEERLGMYPCSSTITGNILLMVFYGAILGVAAKCISDGAELLLDVGVPASIVGGIVLPLLGAVPDSAIIIVSGLGADAQEKLSVGMGTLAGSTIMLLTAAWAGSVLIGRCDLDRHGEAIEGSGHGKFSCTKQGVTVLPDVVTAVIIMLGTSLTYFIVQGADWHFGPTNFGPQPAYIRKAALATMIICFFLFVFYLGFLAYDSKAAERRADKHRQTLIQRRVLHRFVLMANKESGGYDRIDGDEDESAKDAREARIQQKYFTAWHLGSGMKAKDEGKESDPILGTDGSGDDEKDEEPEHEESKTVLGMKSAGLLILGVGLVTIFADPMCDVLVSLTNKYNKSYIPISPFYVSFVVTPLCSNASELVSSLIFAAKKKKENVSMTFSQLYGASTMNNTLCLGIFAALVVFRNLRWYYSAEVTVIVLVQWIVGLAALRHTYKVWMGGAIGAVYICSIGFIALLESSAVGWK
ncbi:sodium/calcium exchanger NCL2 isoform X2 [Exaiptasia diaphana]|uniref:Sodium/calcium exchanger membrane region domain-containing protein n=1 Tax=Exaiptasia diaphana TaxID=2652724 RepID=A0A913XTS4_EXADI|nr:sodium/calcium exchanger NCL2 isoform X2 [Exaiptasia diaphana]